ncbi:MAG: sulfotransferase, partial [Nitrospinota bacterium]
MKGPVKKRVFLVGCARSGTTMLQALLAGHPQIASFPETHFFEKSLPGFAALFSRGFKMHSVLSEWIRLNPVLNLPVHTVGRHWSRKSMVHEFKKVMDNLTKESEKEIWVEKTPGHIMHLDFIEKHFSDAAFIHIMRDGRAVIASLYEVTRKYPEEWGGERPLLECIHEWNERVLKSFQK